MLMWISSLTPFWNRSKCLLAVEAWSSLLNSKPILATSLEFQAAECVRDKTASILQHLPANYVLHVAFALQTNMSPQRNQVWVPPSNILSFGCRGHLHDEAAESKVDLSSSSSFEVTNAWNFPRTSSLLNWQQERLEFLISVLKTF